jgi:alkylation response protein AidB-like acyl-CoA dehydrogenase
MSQNRDRAEDEAAHSWIISHIKSLRPHLEARWPELEAGRRMPLDIVAQLREIGVFRMVTPKTVGGFDLGQRQVCDVLSELSAVDASIGWVALIGAAAGIALSLLPKETFERVYSDGADRIAAGASSATGMGEIVSGGYRVTGRWSFASGCQHADWLFGSFIITKKGLDRPITRMFFLPASQWQIEDTWKVEGLKGTGSHHIALRHTFVPEQNTIDVAAAKPAIPTSLNSCGFRLFPTHHAAFAIGVAESAIAEFVALATGGKVPAAGRTAVKDSQIVQYELGRADAALRAARALLNMQCGIDEAEASAVSAADLASLVRRVQSSVWITETCTGVIDTCYRLAGSDAVYESSPLQRRMRDMRAATQHLWGQLRHYAPAGALRLGHPPVHPAAV